MSTETLAIVGAATGVIGVVIGGASLWWQVVTHRASGRLVMVRSSYLIPIHGDPNRAPEFRNDDQIAVTVINRGGAPVTVLNYGVSMDGKTYRKRNFFPVDKPSWSATLPAVVEAGGKPAQLLVPVADLRRINADSGISFRGMWPWVELGDGRKVFANKAVPLK